MNIMNIYKGHKTKETNYVKLTPNTKLKTRENPNSGAYNPHYMDENKTHLNVNMQNKYKSIHIKT